MSIEKEYLLEVQHVYEDILQASWLMDGRLEDKKNVHTGELASWIEQGYLGDGWASKFIVYRNDKKPQDVPTGAGAPSC
jgi:hypothetical protein